MKLSIDPICNSETNHSNELAFSSCRTILKAKGITHPLLNGKTFAEFRVDRDHHLVSLGEHSRHTIPDSIDQQVN